MLYLRKCLTLLLAIGAFALAPLHTAGATVESLPLFLDPPLEDGPGGIADLWEIFQLLAGDVGLTSNGDLGSLLMEDDAILPSGDYIVVAISSNGRFLNSFGIYSDLDIGVDVDFLFEDVTGLEQPLGPPFSAVEFSMQGDFGLALRSVDTIDPPDGTFLWHSQSGLDRGVGAVDYDHLASYAFPDPITLVVDRGQGGEEVVIRNARYLAWEDLNENVNGDYDDLTLVIGTLRSVPEPGTVALVGLGLAGLGWRGRSRSR